LCFLLSFSQVAIDYQKSIRKKQCCVMITVLIIGIIIMAITGVFGGGRRRRRRLSVLEEFSLVAPMALGSDLDAAVGTGSFAFAEGSSVYSSLHPSPPSNIFGEEAALDRSAGKLNLVVDGGVATEEAVVGGGALPSSLPPLPPLEEAYFLSDPLLAMPLARPSDTRDVLARSSSSRLSRQAASSLLPQSKELPSELPLSEAASFSSPPASSSSLVRHLRG
jgi:hypothetical protein